MEGLNGHRVDKKFSFVLVQKKNTGQTCDNQNKQTIKETKENGYSETCDQEQTKTKKEEFAE